VLIEKVWGKSYYDFVAENIYKVAGMTHSGSEPESVEVASASVISAGEAAARSGCAGDSTIQSVTTLGVVAK